MRKIKMLWKGKFSLFKTLYLNFKVLPFHQAIRLPIAVSRKVKIADCKRNAIQINARINMFMVSFGFGGSSDLIDYNPESSYLSIRGNGKLIVSGTARFAPHFSLLIKDSIMKLGAGFSCNNGCVFSCMSGIEFGENCLLGGGIVIRDSDGHKIYDNASADSTKNESNRSKAIKIGNHVWICNKSDILKGVSIGNDCVVSYRSLVVQSIEGNNLLIGGSPAKMIKKNITWEQ